MSDFIHDDPSFYEDFLVEAQEHFEMMEQNFLELEGNPGDLEILNGIFRSVHTIKGAAGFLGLDKIQGLAHVGENVLDDLRKGRMTPTPDVMDALFETVDLLKVLVGDVGIALKGQGEPTNPDTSGAIKKLEFLRSNPASAAAPAPPPPPPPPGYVNFPEYLADLTPEMKEKITTAVHGNKGVLCLKIKLLPSVVGTHFEPVTILSMMELLGEPVVSDKLPLAPSAREAWHTDKYAFDLVMAFIPVDSVEIIQRIFGALKNAQVRYFSIKTDGSVEELVPAGGAVVAAAPAAPAVIPTPPPAPVVEAPKPAQPAPDAPSTDDSAAKHAETSAKPSERPPEKVIDKTADTIRVSQAKLDGFMNIVAELIMSKTMVSHVVERFESEARGEAVDELVRDLRRASVTLDQVSKEIQGSIMSIRMVPVKTVFNKFPRMLRDLAKASGKKIELQMVGEDTEIDKSLIEELGDPMIHLIRNSADHGIEMPEVRKAAGKSEAGLVVLRARHEGDSVIVEIEDDGKGIDPVIIKAKAVEKGLITQEKADTLSNDEIINFIFAPGFSTAAKITDISGRGVGMDVVRSNVRRLNGSVQVQSVVGKGSVFTLRLPLTLAIIDALLMKSREQVFALPGTSVEETLLVAHEDLSFLTRRKAINLRGEVLGVSRLSDLLNLKNQTIHEEQEQEEEEAIPASMPVVVVSAGGRRMGLIVDAFVKRQEMVIKPLAPYLASLPGISGASIMGDGAVVLILDPAELISLAVQEAS